jgi:hypothetical protein
MSPFRYETEGQLQLNTMNLHVLTIVAITTSLLGCQPRNQPPASTMNASTSPSEMSSSKTPSGVYFIGGSIDRGGVYSLGTGVTLLQAVISAAGSHGKIEVTADIIRHTGENPQFIRNIPIGEILAGRRPDVILEPGDVINVLQEH